MQFKPSLVLVTAIATSNFASAAPVRKITPKLRPNYTSKPHRFAVWFPAKIENSKTVSGPTPQGETITMFFVATGIEPIFYTVVSAKNPPSAVKMTPQTRLDFARDGMMQNSTSKILSEKRIQLGAIPGRDIVMTVASGTEGQRMRIYTTPKRLVQVVARAPQSNMKKYDAQITKVFDSLRILPE